MIKVYTKPGCVQCNATKTALEKAGLDFVMRDVMRDPEAATEAMALSQTHGRELPIVVAPSDTWTGFRPDIISKLKSELTQ